MSLPGTDAGDSVTLSGDELDAYVAQASALLRTAKLSAHFPSGQLGVRTSGVASGAMLAGYVQAMGTPMHRGLYTQLEVDLQAGLPTFKEWTRVLVDISASDAVLRELPPVETLRARAPRDPSFGKQLLKYCYHTDLQKLSLPPFERLEVRLQKRPSEEGAQFQLTLDKLDARGLPLRCVAEITQGPDAPPLITLQGERAEAKKELWGTLYRLISLDAELTFIHLHALPGLKVHKISVGTVGPLLCGAVAALRPQLLPASLLQRKETALLTCAVDIITREEGPDRDNDPLAPLWSTALSSSARGEYAQARKRLGYRISRDRKFVADAASLPAIQALCAQAGTNNVIYTLPPQSAPAKGA